MKNIVPLLLLTTAVASLAVGCLLKKQTVVTGSATVGYITNTVTVVNDTVLAAECAGLRLVGTPALTYVIRKYPSSRPVILDVQEALNGALNGADTNVTATIEGFLGKDQALDDQLTPLIQAASDLRGELIQKYGPSNAGKISLAILQSDLAIVNSALATTK